MDRALNVHIGFFFFSLRRRWWRYLGRQRKKVGIVLPEFIVAGCWESSKGRVTERERRKEGHKRAEEEGEQQFDLRTGLSLIVHRSCFFVVGFCPEEQLQNFLGPQTDACFGATPVPNVGKSSALLMSGALFPDAFQGASRTTKPFAGPPLLSSPPPAPPPPP